MRLLEVHDEQGTQTALTVLVGDSYHERPSNGLRHAMEKAVDQMRATMPRQSMHDCDMHVQWNRDLNRQIKCCVLDGKVMGPQVCRVQHCESPIVSRKRAFCRHHEHLADICRVVGCSEKRISADVECCSNLDHVQLWKSYLKAKHLKAAYKKKARAEGKSKPASVNDARKQEEFEDAQMMSGGLVAHFGPAYQPDVLVFNWSCGVVPAIKPIFSTEKFEDVAAFVEDTLQMMDENDRPDVAFFDSACRFGPFLKRNPQYTFGNRVRWVVDRFHICGHKESDEVCQEHYAPKVVDLVNQGCEPMFASSMAETTNRWLSRISSFLRDVDDLTFNFILLSMVQWRNDNIVKKGIEARLSLKTTRSQEEEELIERVSNMIIGSNTD